MRKKLLSLVLALTMMLSMGTVAMAEGTSNTTFTDDDKVELSKLYSIQNEGTTNPAETFNFTISKYKMSDSGYTSLDEVPNIFFDKDNDGIYDDDELKGSISFNVGEATVSGDTNTTYITLPKYDYVGIYTYKIVENAGTTAGVTYDDNVMYLKVTAIEQNGIIRVAALHYETDDGDKEEYFENVYAAGSLSVSKKVTGNLGDKSKYFAVKVKLTGESGKTYLDSYNVTEVSYTNNPKTIKIGEETTFYLKDGEKITISNLPYGVSYTVKEEDYTAERYDAPVYEITAEGSGTYNVDGEDVKLTAKNPVQTIGSMNSGSDKLAYITDDCDDHFVAITNNKEEAVDTGINLDSMPYILILAAVAVGGVAIISKKRREEF